MNQEQVSETRAAIRIRLGAAEITIDGHASFIERVIEKVMPILQVTPQGETMEDLATNEQQGGRIAPAQAVLTQRGHVNITESLRRLQVGQDVILKTTISYAKNVATRTGHVYDYMRDGRMLRVRRVA
jgi:hypothetical protein